MTIPRPVEMGAWVSLSPRGNIGMTGYAVSGDSRIGLQQQAGNTGKSTVLGISEVTIIRPFELYANGKFIALVTPLKTGYTGVMRFQVERHILGDLPLPIDQQMGRNPQVFNVVKEWMNATIQAIAEQIIYIRTTKFTRRQTDIVNHQQTDIALVLPHSMIWRCQETGRGKQMIFDIHAPMLPQAPGCL